MNYGGPETTIKMSDCTERETGIIDSFSSNILDTNRTLNEAMNILSEMVEYFGLSRPEVSGDKRDDLPDTGLGRLTLHIQDNSQMSYKILNDARNLSNNVIGSK